VPSRNKQEIVKKSLRHPPKWAFTFRKKKCCPRCGTFLLIASDLLSDDELAELRSFWMWEPLKERWDYIRDWEEHKREALRKFEEYSREVPARSKLKRSRVH
jgi:hypothetical protein